MSNFKEFGQQGVASDLQFGKGGGRILFRDGVFQFVATPTGITLSRVKAAPPSEGDDAVTLDVMSAAVNTVCTKLDNEISTLTSNFAVLQNQIGQDKSTASQASTALTSEVSSLSTGLAELQTHLGQIKYDTIVSPDGSHKAVAGPDGIQLSSPVVVGDGNEDGVIQPEGGHSLTIAGGDAESAGSVVIRGGQGANPGHVEVHDLVDPVHDGDAVSLSCLNTALGKVAGSSQTNSVRALYASFSETAGDTTLGKFPAGVLLRLKVSISDAFAAGASITLRGSTQTFVTPDSVDETQTGIYVVELLQETSADTLVVSLTTPGGTGKGMIALEYISL